MAAFRTALLYQAGIGLLTAALTVSARAQDDPFDPAWFDPAFPYVKLGVVEDGVYAVSGADLRGLGVSLDAVDPASLRLFENGREIPAWYTADPSAPLTDAAALLFVGRRNRGDREAWAYDGNEDRQSSTYFSLYSDTTYYWLTWGAAAGRRYETPAPTAPGTPRTTLRDTVHLEEDTYYYYGDSEEEAAQPPYTRGEGYYWHALAHADVAPITRTFDLPLDGLDAAGDTLNVRVRLSSETAPRHRVTLALQTPDGTPLACTGCTDEADWNGYAFRTLQGAVPQTLLPPDGTLRVVVTSHNEFNSVPNRVLIDWVETDYIKHLAYEGEATSFAVPEAGPSTFRLSAGPGGPIAVFAPGSGRRFAFTGPEDGAYTFSDTPDGPERYWIAGPGGPQSPVHLQRVTLGNLADPSQAADYVIVTTPALLPSAQAMAAYRESQDGFTVAIVFQHDLFDQFDYGRTTPLAVRRFVHATRGWQVPPRFFLFWGDTNRPEAGLPRRPLFPWEVISFGYAPADGWFAMQLEGPDDLIERAAIGRIPIRDNETGQFFVDKIGAYERAPRSDWQKRMLMLVGGKDDVQQSLLQNHTLQWGDRAAGPPAAMDTLRFFKSATDPLDTSFQDSLRVAFRNGTSWVTYFGHSAADTWEIVVDDPEDFDNADRLPIVLSMGCNTGNFAGGRFEFPDRLVFGERLVLSSFNGAIAHWGSSSSSTINTPASLADLLHGIVFQDTVRVLGTALQEAKRRFAETRASTFSNYRTLLQYGLIGDPATHIPLARRPDFSLTPENIRITPTAPIPADSALVVTVDVLNHGLAPADSFTVALTHTRPDGRAVAYRLRLAPDFPLRTTATFVVSIDGAAVGENRLAVQIDPDNTVGEEDELNNTAEQSHTVFSAGVSLVTPAPFALVRSPQPRLRAGVSSADAQSRTVLFELDTTDGFDTPALRTHQAASTSLTADWLLETPLADGIYYWRARIDDPDQPAEWSVGAFTVRAGAGEGTAWSQEDALFAANETDPFIRWDSTSRQWALQPFEVAVRASSERGNGDEKGQFVVNGDAYLRVTLGWGVLVLDGTTGAVRTTASFPTFDLPADLEERFDTDSARAVADLTALLTSLREDDYVFFRTRHLGNLSGPTIQEEVKTLFRDLGSSAIDTLTYDAMWLMATRVGRPGETREWVEPPGTVNEFARDTVLTFQRPSGTVLSPPIGPASVWRDVQAEVLLSGPASAAAFDVLSATGDASLLQDLPLSGTVSLAAVDARQHPFLRLRMTLTDTTRQATPQLLRWQAGYDPVPELALDPAETSLSADTLIAGTPLTVRTALVNIGETIAPEAVVAYYVTDATNVERLIDQDTLRMIQPDAPVAVETTFATEDLAGVNRLRLVAEQDDLREPLASNNVLVREFLVRSDAEPPAFEVRIDDEALPPDPEPVRNLQDPALPFVSARPLIEVTITDAGAVQPLSDSSIVTLTLDGRSIPLSDPAVLFEPATEAQPEARLRFQPDLSARDTTHTLVVRAFDTAGNEATDSPYQVHFRIQQALQIESLYPYPNPMHTHTTFAFRLRGADASLTEDFRIRIYTIGGRLIREFDLIDDPSALETAGLRIGWNKLRWDGRDADGDLLATGVYLYKVFLRAEGRTLDVNNRRSVEKLVVIR